MSARALFLLRGSSRETTHSNDKLNRNWALCVNMTMVVRSLWDTPSNHLINYSHSRRPAPGSQTGPYNSHLRARAAGYRHSPPDEATRSHPPREYLVEHPSKDVCFHWVASLRLARWTGVPEYRERCEKRVVDVLPVLSNGFEALRRRKRQSIRIHTNTFAICVRISFICARLKIASSFFQMLRKLLLLPDPLRRSMKTHHFLDINGLK